jgi:hypothetical protein
MRRLVKFLFGFPVALLFFRLPLLKRYSNYLVSTWLNTKGMSKLDQFLYPVIYFVWLKYIYLREEDPDKREALKSIAMGGESGKNWAQIYNENKLDLSSKFSNMKFTEANPLFVEIPEYLSKLSEKKRVVVQIGSSSGKEIAYFSSLFSQIKFIGTDIYDSVIEFSKQQHSLENLSFEKCSAQDLPSLLTTYTKKELVVYSSGSLQYVQPEHMEFFFKKLSEFPSLKIFLLDPADFSIKNPDEIRGSLWRGNFSYTHDYKYYAEMAGLKTIKSQIIKPYSSNDPVHSSTCHYYYFGETKPR